MIGMRDFEYRQQIVIRSVGEVRGMFDRIISELQTNSRLRFRGRKVTREAVGNAVWVMLADMDAEQRETLLAPYLGRLELILAETDDERAAVLARIESMPAEVVSEAIPLAPAPEPALPDYYEGPGGEYSRGIASGLYRLIEEGVDAQGEPYIRDSEWSAPTERERQHLGLTTPAPVPAPERRGFIGPQRDETEADIRREQERKRKLREEAQRKGREAQGGAKGPKKGEPKKKGQ